MAWLRIDDGFAHHPKLEGWTAAQKWALIELFCYCARHKTEGHVPSDLSILPRAVTPSVLALAERSGIIDRDEDNLLSIHDWSDYNPSDPTAALRMQRMRERNANRNEQRNEVSNEARNESVSSRARLPSRPQGVSNDTPGERARDELWDALVAELGDPKTKTERGRYNAAHRELREIAATPAEVRGRCRAYRRKWPEIALTPQALTGNWTQLEPLPEPTPRPVAEVLDLPEISEEERQANAARIRELAGSIGKDVA